MPSIALELGRYVTTRPRKDGTVRVFFQVPKRLAPADWPSLIPLPISGRRVGDLSDADEVSRIQADAKALYRDLNASRLGRAKPQGRNFATLIRRYQEGDGWKTNRPRTQKSYTTYLNHITRWAEVCKPANPDPGRITRADVNNLLSLFPHPTTKKNVLKLMRLLMEEAISLGWRAENPCVGIRITGAKVKVGIWEQADVDAYVAAADARGYPSISLMILLEWEIGQRLTDVRAFRAGAEYNAAEGVFRFEQSKTGESVAIPVSGRLRELLDAVEGGQMFLFRNERTGKAYTEERLSKTFAWVRNAAVKAGARTLLLKWLRHSCVVQLARAGCTVPEIGAITGHAPLSVNTILKSYLPRDSQVARNAQIKRGLL